MSEKTVDEQNDDTRTRPWTVDEINKIRIKTNEILTKLDDELQVQKEQQQTQQEQNYESWLNGTISLHPTNDNSLQITDKCRYFDMFGFVKVHDIVSSTMIQQLKQDMTNFTETWDPLKEIMAFQTDEESNNTQGSNDYFLESAARVHFFAEPSALDEQGNLKPEYQQNVQTKLAALNKAGHGMHTVLGSSFHQYSTSTAIRSLVNELGWIDPIIPQSMYIFKQPQIGGAIHSHQDSTFLYTEPKQSCLGLWLALDDATLENGCLWVRPKSHKEHVRRQFKRNVQYFGQNAIDERSNIRNVESKENGAGETNDKKDDNDDDLPPKMIMERLVTDEYYNTTAPWEGELPPNAEQPLPHQGLLDAGFVPIECKAGDLLAFGGQLDHLSLPNYSTKQRHTFQLHLVEGPKNKGIQWSKYNWLQYPSHKQFMSIALNDDDDDDDDDEAPKA